MRRIRTSGEQSWADGNAGAGEKLVLSSKASQWTEFLGNHATLLAAINGHDINLGGKEAFTKVVEEHSTSTTLDSPPSEGEQGDVRKILLGISGGDDPVTFRLPTVAFGSTPPGLMYIAQRYSQNVAFTPGTGDSILMPWGTVTDSTHIQCDDPYGIMCLMSDGSDAWVPVWATGEWYEAGTPTNLHRYDGSISGGVTGNLVSIDAQDNITDSGYAPSAFLPRQMTSVSFNSDPGVSTSDYGKHYWSTSAGGLDPALFTVRAFGQVGANFIVERRLVDVELSCYTGESILMPWGSVPDTESLRCDTPYGAMHLISIGSGYWMPLWATGEWYLASDTTKRYRYDGNVPGATSGHFASFDSLGNIRDSSYSATNFASVSHATQHLSGGSDVLEYRAEQFFPIADANDHSEDAPAALENLVDSPAILPIRKFDPTTQEEVSFLWEVPDDIQADDGIYVTVVGAISEATAPVSGEGVVFQAAGYCVGTGDELGKTWGTAQHSQETDLHGAGVDAQYKRFRLSTSAKITVTDLAAGELVVLRLYRDVADSNDDYAQDVGISGIRVHYNKIPIQGF